jgi:signal transduction histidine kinase
MNAWWRGHPMLLDGTLALCLLGLGANVFTSFSFRSSGLGDQAGLAAISLVLAVLVVLRRRYPTATFAIAAAIGAVQVTLGSRPASGTAIAGAFQPVSADVAIIVLLYTLAANRPRRVSLYGLAVCLVGITYVVIQWPLSHGRETPQHMLLFALVLGVPTVSAWVLGQTMAYRRAYYAWLEERARRAEAERDTRAQIAVAAERARIAREMHDVIAHNVSVIVVQADGAAYAFDDDPARARQAIDAISRTGRQALAEMRRLLGVLRDGEETDMAPQPGLTQISELLTEARLAGLPVSLTIEGAPRPLDTGRELAAYRIVQEALTNARKHGGLGADAAVLLHYTENGGCGCGSATPVRCRRPGTAQITEPPVPETPVQKTRGTGSPGCGNGCDSTAERCGPGRGRAAAMRSPPRCPPRPTRPSRHDDPRRAGRRPGTRAYRLPHGA